jgi:hypothetical protein
LQVSGSEALSPCQLHTLIKLSNLSASPNAHL